MKQYRVPSIETMRRYLPSSVTIGMIRLVRRVLTVSGRDELCDLIEQLNLRNTAAYIRRCHYPPEVRMVMLYAANEIMGGYGVEGAALDRHSGFSYVNFGDPYCPTLILDLNGNFIVRSWGDYVEGLERRGIRFS